MSKLLYSRSFIAALAACLLGPALPARAQSQSAGGTIQGTVRDESGAALPGVSVSIRNEATGIVRETRTDATGVYKAPLLPVGSYEVAATLQGFATTRRPGQRLTVGAVLDADLSLKVASQTEEVTVTAEAPLIESTRAAQASTVNERAVANLPVNGRNFIDFTLTTPGVVKDTRTGDISFAGQRGTLNSLVIDGADNNNTFFGQTLGRTGSGRAPYQFSQDAVQEFEVNRNAYSAEYGRAGGAVINVVTKSGTNAFHGSAFEFFRDDSLDANSYANKIRTPVTGKQELRIHQFGASLGGPIVKDKAFFFLSYDAQRRSIPNPITLTLPSNLPTDPETQAGLSLVQSKAGDYSLTRDQDVFLAKVDWQLDSKHRLTFRYNHQNFTGGNNESSGATSAEEHTGDSLVRTRTANVSLSSVFSPSLFNELRVQYGKDEEPGEANTNDPEVNSRQGGQTVLVFGRNFFSPRETTITRWQVADVLTTIRGRHTIKAGFDFNFDDILNYFPGNFGGRYFFNSLASLGRGIPNGTGESYQQGFAGVGTTGPTTEPNLKEYAVFAQDEWRAATNLTLTLGLRYDYQDIAQPQTRNPDPQLAAAGIDTSVIPVDGNNLAPRVGFAWTPRKELVVRGGYGIFYGRTPSIMIGTAHSGNAVNVTNVTFTGATVPTYPNVFATIPTGAALPRPSIQFFDPDFQNPCAPGQPRRRLRAHEHPRRGRSLPVRGRPRPAPLERLQRGRSGGDPRSHPGRRSLERAPLPHASLLELRSHGALREHRGVEVQRRHPRAAQAVRPAVAGEPRLYPGQGRGHGARRGQRGPGGRGRRALPVGPQGLRAGPRRRQQRRATPAGVQRVLGPLLLQGERSPRQGPVEQLVVVLDRGDTDRLPYSPLVTNDLNNDGNRANDIVPGSRNTEACPPSTNIDLRLQKRIPMGKANLDLMAEAFNLLNSTIISNRQRTFYNFTNGVLIPQQNLSNPRLNFGADSAALDARAIQLAAKITF